MAELLISLYEQERVSGNMFEPYSLASIAYNAVEDGWTALKYARLAVEAGRMFPGPAHPEVKDMESMIGGPRSHWSWALKKPKEKTRMKTRIRSRSLDAGLIGYNGPVCLKSDTR
jgi:hypothetical protein